MVGTPIDSNLRLKSAATVSGTDVEAAIDVEPGSDAELHVAYTALTSSATLKPYLEARVDGTNYVKIWEGPVVPTTEDAPGTTIGTEIKVHFSAPVYIPKSTQADAYSGSLRRTSVRFGYTIGGSGTVTALEAWLAPVDEGSTPARERLVAAGV